MTYGYNFNGIGKHGKMFDYMIENTLCLSPVFVLFLFFLLVFDSRYKDRTFGSPEMLE